MRGKIVFAALVLSLSGGFTAAQDKPLVPRPSDLYCSGLVTTESVPVDTYVITGEQSNYKITFDEGDYVYINKGSDQGAKVGDEFSVVRPMKDSIKIEWTKWQTAILSKMGTVWEDEARLKVINARPDVSIAQVENSCDYIQRGDIVLPFTERPAPPLKMGDKFDRFAPADGKPMAMVITGKKFQQQVGNNDVVYINLGNSQGVKVGDYFRIFRYQGTEHETAYQTPVETPLMWREFRGQRMVSDGPRRNIIGAMCLGRLGRGSRAAHGSQFRNRPDYVQSAGNFRG